MQHAHRLEERLSDGTVLPIRELGCPACAGELAAIRREATRTPAQRYWDEHFEALNALPPVFGCACAPGSMAVPWQDDETVHFGERAWRGIERIGHTVTLRISHGPRSSAVASTEDDLQLFEFNGCLWFALDHGSRARTLRQRVEDGEFSGCSVGLAFNCLDTVDVERPDGSTFVLVTAARLGLSEISLVVRDRVPRVAGTWVGTQHTEGVLDRIPPGHPFLTAFATPTSYDARAFDVIRFEPPAPAQLVALSHGHATPYSPARLGIGTIPHTADGLARTRPCSRFGFFRG
jgi:phage head maturation protease